MIQIHFGNNFIYLKTNKLIPSKKLLKNIKQSHKYHQIVTSIKSLDIIKPIIIFYNKNKNITKILDSHLRVKTLKNLDIKKAPYILSNIDNTFTPNKQVNHINIVKKHKIIIKSLAKVSIKKLSATLGISINAIKNKANIINSIDSSIIAKLSNKPIPKATFNILRKIKPIRQIKAVDTIINFNNYNKKFAISILDATPASIIINKGKNTPYKKDIKKTILHLKQKIATTSKKTKKLQTKYGSNMLKFIIIQSYINKLLSNSKVLHWFLKNKINYLNKLKKISKINSLDNKTLTKNSKS